MSLSEKFVLASLYELPCLASAAGHQSLVIQAENKTMRLFWMWSKQKEGLLYYGDQRIKMLPCQKNESSLFCFFVDCLLEISREMLYFSMGCSRYFPIILERWLLVYSSQFKETDSGQNKKKKKNKPPNKQEIMCMSVLALCDEFNRLWTWVLDICRTVM